MRVSATLLAALAGIGLATGSTAQDPKDAPGKELFVTRCTVCHVADTATEHRGTPEDWHIVVDKMILNGATLTGPERETIEAYLSLNYGPDQAETGPAPKAGATPKP